MEVIEAVFCPPRCGMFSRPGTAIAGTAVDSIASLGKEISSSENDIMKSFARSLSSAQQTVLGIDTKDISSLAYVSGLVALETMIPFVNAAEVEFTVMVEDNGTVTIDPVGLDIDAASLATINIVASHYFQTRRLNLPVVVH
jgi:hypothetical protein